MNHSFDAGELTVYLSGHIDTGNAAEVEKEILEQISRYSPEKIVLDAQDLEYISSSGLRIILKLRKIYKDIRMVQVSSEVYEILDMTGFTEMMTIEKAFRCFDVTGCQIIGKGANGTVYRYDRDTIVKVYKPNADLEEIKQERELSRTAFVLGVPTAIPYDVVKVGDSFGSVFELLNAKSFDELMIEDSNNLEFVVQKSMEIAKILHSTLAPHNLSSQQKTALKWVAMLDGYIDNKDLQKLKKLIEELPDRDTMIHGDFHIKNIMQQNDETLLIDLDTLSKGHPVFEFAFMFNAYSGFGIVDRKKIENFLGISIETAYSIWTRSLEVYFDNDDPDFLLSIEEKAAIIGYMRLMRSVIRKHRYDTADGKAFFDACYEKLRGLLPKYDTLDF